MAAHPSVPRGADRSRFVAVRVSPAPPCNCRRRSPAAVAGANHDLYPYLVFPREFRAGPVAPILQPRAAGRGASLAEPGRQRNEERNLFEAKSLASGTGWSRLLPLRQADVPGAALKMGTPRENWKEVGGFLSHRRRAFRPQGGRKEDFPSGRIRCARKAPRALTHCACPAMLPNGERLSGGRIGGMERAGSQRVPTGRGDGKAHYARKARSLRSWPRA